MNPLTNAWIGRGLMIAGIVLWLTGEICGVLNKRANMDTTSEWFWYAEAHWPILRLFIAGFFVSLVGHLLWKTDLLP
jgi:hypothetical protein